MALTHGIRRLPGGGIRVRLSGRERDLLRSLPDQLRPLLAGERDVVTDAGRLSDRLYPSAYDDPLDELEYRELIGTSVSSERLAAVEAFARTLDGGTARRLTWSTHLDADEAHAWLSALNDARLTLAMVVGVTDESVWDRGPSTGDDRSLALYYLGWLQEQLLAALSGTLQDDPG